MVEYKWNPETKSLEELIEPKFKNGDILYIDCNDDNYTYKVLDVMVLPDNAIGVQLIRKKKDGSTSFIFRFTNNTNGVWRIGKKDYSINSDEVLYEFYKDVQNGLTEKVLESLNG